MPRGWSVSDFPLEKLGQPAGCRVSRVTRAFSFWLCPAWCHRFSKFALS